MIFSHDSLIRNWLPRLQSHRGFLAHGAIQNTLASVKAAYDLGYEIAEFDVSLTSDHICILFHDSSFNGKEVRHCTLQELRSQTEITTLQELLDWFVQTPDFKLNIEIKSRDIFNFELEKQVADFISVFAIERRVIVSSFNPLTLFKIRLLCPQVYRAILLTLENEQSNNFFTRNLILNFLCRPHVLNLRYDDYSEKFKQLAKSIPVVLWTVNDISNFNKIRNEIHGIISDDITPLELKVKQHAENH